MNKVYSDLSVEQIKNMLQKANQFKPERTFVFTKATKIKAIPPTENRKTHRIRLELEFPEYMFVDDELVEFGVMGLLHIARYNIDSNYLKKGGEE